jgi:hypothetical protein
MRAETFIIEDESTLSPLGLQARHDVIPLIAERPELVPWKTQAKH